MYIAKASVMMKMVKERERKKNIKKTNAVINESECCKAKYE